MPILGNFKSSRSTIRLRNLVQVAVGQEWAIFKPSRSMTRLRNLSQVRIVARPEIGESIDRRVPKLDLLYRSCTVSDSLE